MKNFSVLCVTLKMTGIFPDEIYVRIRHFLTQRFIPPRAQLWCKHCMSPPSAISINEVFGKRHSNEQIGYLRIDKEPPCKSFCTGFKILKDAKNFDRALGWPF